MRLSPAFLLLAAGLLALPTQAADYAPAEDRPGRIVLVPMSVERPQGEGWVLVRRDEMSLTFIHPADGDGNSQVADAASRVPDWRAHDSGELAARMREEMDRIFADKRFEKIAEEIQPETANAGKCARYSQQVRDLASHGADGRPQVIRLFGLACLHPADEGVLLTATFSERSAEGKGTPGIEQIARRYLDGIRPHALLKGDDWQPLAEQGDANAQVWLGRSLVLRQKPEQGMDWLRRAAEQGHLEAQTLLGLASLRGHDQPLDARQALKWLLPAAERGYAKAQGALAIAYLQVAEIRDEAASRRWLAEAAQGGDPFGQALLGELLLSGRAGWEKNEAAGLAWTRKAAAQGDANSSLILSRLLANGIGGAKDPAQARFWLELAAAQGQPEARKLVEQSRPASSQPPVAPPAGKP
ncbi:MAG TPA: tetratricopeptide repeat protein [Candidatus Desulfobacillus sp.]|nr:tetratricopeptide repeat protein [Candidatus Desulfobacillus sp.]